MLLRFLLPQGRFHATPLFAGASTIHERPETTLYARDRRRDDRLGPGSTKRAFEKTTYSVILCILHPGLLSVDSARLLRERSGPAVRPQIIPPTARGDAAAATWIFRGACAAAPARPRVRRDPAGNPHSTLRRAATCSRTIHALAVRLATDARIPQTTHTRQPPAASPRRVLGRGSPDVVAPGRISGGAAATCSRTIYAVARASQRLES